MFLAAVESDGPAERAAVLDRECAGDTGLRERVEILLRAHDQPDSLLDRPIVAPDVREGGTLAVSSGPDRRSGASSDATFTPRATVAARPDPGAETSDSGGPTESTHGMAPAPAVPGYEILGELGRGGMGVVYRARQVRLNRPCVLKMILGGGHAGAEAGARFLAEAEAVARLQHANVVQIHHIGEADGLPYFELEYLEGGSLDRRLNGTPWPARRAAELIERLARGVAERTAWASSTAT